MSDLIEDIKRFKISDVIGKFYQLKRAGNEKYKCCCPFHHEKTPSFYVDDREGYFKCFGCGEGGDVITFIQKLKGYDFKQAIDEICNLLYIDKSQYEGQFINYEKNREINKTSYQALELIQNYYYNSLQNDEKALDYVINTRHLTKETIDEFKIGLATANKLHLKAFCEKNQIADETLLNIDILRNSEQNENSTEDQTQTYLTFRNRIIIPICDNKGRTIAFGGRIYQNGEQGAKYLNSAETSLFKKSMVLFNFHRAKKNLNQNNKTNRDLLVVEGYMDAIALYQNDFKTAVAPLGTSITEYHIRTIINYSKSPIFLFDSDGAGKKASARACEMLLPMLKVGVVPRFCSLVGAKDADEFLNKFTPNELQEQLDNAVEIQQFLWNIKTEEYDIANANPNQIAELETTLNNLIRQIPDTTLQTNYKEYFSGKIEKIKTDNGWSLQKQTNKKSKFEFKNGKWIPKNETIMDVKMTKISIDQLENQILDIIAENQNLLDDEDFIVHILPQFLEKNRERYDDIVEIGLPDKEPQEQENKKAKTEYDNLIILWKLKHNEDANIQTIEKDNERKKILQQKREQLQKLLEDDEEE